MKNVWTPSQGTIHNPSPARSSVCFKSPVARFALVSATSIASPSTVPRVTFRSRYFTRALLHPVIRRFFGDDHVVHVTLFPPRGRHTNEPRILLQLLNRPRPAIPHARAKPAHQ